MCEAAKSWYDNLCQDAILNRSYRCRRRRREQAALKPILPLKVTPSESSTHLAGPRLQWEQNEAGAMVHWPGASTWLAATPGRERAAPGGGLCPPACLLACFAVAAIF